MITNFSEYEEGDIIKGQHGFFIVKMCKSKRQRDACIKCYFSEKGCHNNRVEELNNTIPCTALLGLRGKYFEKLEGGL